MWRNFKHLVNDFYINFINNQRHSFYYVNPFEFVESYLGPRIWSTLGTCLCFWKLSWLIVLFKLFIYRFSINFVLPISERNGGICNYDCGLFYFSSHSHQSLLMSFETLLLCYIHFGLLCSCHELSPLLLANRSPLSWWYSLFWNSNFLIFIQPIQLSFG